MPAKYFFGFIISFIGGVGLESVLHFGYPLGVLFLFLGVTLLLLRSVRSGSGNSFLVSLLFIALALGVFRADAVKMKQDPHVLDKFLKHTVTFYGIVTKEPDVREEYTNIVLEPRSVFDGTATTSIETSTKILVRVPMYPVFHYGDEGRFTGKLAVPQNFSSAESVKDFDYKTYLAKDNIFYQLYFPRTEIVTQGNGNIIFEKLFTFKESFLKNITHRIPEPEASLAGGILLGAKQSLGEELLQKFRETGVAHIVVLSGYNIAVVAAGLSSALYFLPFTARIIASVIGVVLFAMMVGGGATVVRATIMVLVVLILRAVGRENDALRGLVLAGGIMVSVSPMILLYDISFQLSFMATLALVVLAPRMEKYFSFISQRVMREIFITTLATQIFVLPLILYYMGSISLVGLMANIFILPVVPVAMLAVALVAVFAFVPILGSMLAALSYGVLWYMIFAVETFSRLPFAQITGVKFSLTLLVVGYLTMGVFLARDYFSRSRRISSLLR